MLVAIISDTHMPRGARRLPDRCVELLDAADLTLHAGDFCTRAVLAEIEAHGPVVAVHGNVDESALVRALPERRTVEVDGARIAMVHDAGPARGRLERLRRASPTPTPSCSAIRTSRCTSGRPTASRSSTPAAPPSAAARRATRWGWRASKPARSSSSWSRSKLAAAMDLSIFFAGTAGSVPTARRGLPALLVRRGGDRILFDCGEGTQRQLLGSVGLPELTDVFITHYHADHWLGLPGMLKTFDLRARERPLTVHGPPGLQVLLASLRRVYGRLSYDAGPRGARAGRGGARATATRWPRSRSPTGCRPSATRCTRTAAPATWTPSWRSGWAWRRAPTSGACSAARRSTASRPSR